MNRHPLLFVLLILLASISHAQQRRPLAVDDYYSLKEVSGPRMSPDGKWIAFELSSRDKDKDKTLSNIYMVSTSGGTPVQLTFSGEDESPAWSPDNQYLAFLSGRGDESQVYLLNRSGGEAYPVTSVPQGVERFEWSPDSKRLLLVITDKDPDEKEGDKAPPPFVITRLYFKADGTGYLKELYKHLYVLELSTRTLKQITSGPYDDADPLAADYSSPPHWSPDGKQIVFVSNRTTEPDSNTNTDVFVVSSSGGQPKKLTTNEGPDETPSWSPDGTSIVYVTSTEPEYMWFAQLELATISVEGGAPKILTTEIDRNCINPQYGPDGRIYFQLEDNGTQRLVSIPPQGGTVREETSEKIVYDFDFGNSGTIVFSAVRSDLPGDIFLTVAGKTTAMTHVNEDFLKTVELGKTERIAFTGKDGTSLAGFVIKPPGFSPAMKYSAILWMHGGPNVQETGEFYFRPQILASAGYVIIQIDYRGSTGYGKQFQQSIYKDWGNREARDLLAGVEYVVSLGYIDPNRLGMGGHSYGAMLTNYLITKTDRFKAAITDAGESNYFIDYGVDQYFQDWEVEVGKPWENPQRYLEMSPYFQLKNVKTPTLVGCGQEAWNVPLVNSEQLYLSLRRLGVDAMLLVYPDQPHEFWRPSYITDRYRRYLAWYGHFLKGEPDKVPPRK